MQNLFSNYTVMNILNMHKIQTTSFNTMQHHSTFLLVAISRQIHARPWALLSYVTHTVRTVGKWGSSASLELEVNWQKTKVQALACRENMPSTIKVQGQHIMVVEEFVYLGSLIHSSTGSTCDISRRSAITRAAMQSLENQIRRSRFAISTKLKLYNTCILPIFLYGSDRWAISKTDAR